MNILGVEVSNGILKWGGIAGALVAIGTVASWAVTTTEPLVVSGGTFPAASETEVASAISALTTQVQSTQAHQIDQDLLLNESRRNAVLSDVAQVQELLKRNPNSLVLQKALAQDNTDLGDLIAEHAQLVQAKRRAFQPYRKK